MLRRSRIDVSGAFHHKIARGIDRQRIFTDDADRDNFLDRLGNILSETQTACFAWALIPNHFHLWAKAENLAACSQYGGKARRSIGQPQQLFVLRLKETYNLMSLNFSRMGKPVCVLVQLPVGQYRFHIAMGKKVLAGFSRQWAKLFSNRSFNERVCLEYSFKSKSFRKTWIDGYQLKI